MFKLTLKMAWRYALKSKSFVVICLLSLILGITCFSFIGLWAKDELNHDRTFFAAENTYRLESVLQEPDGTMNDISANGWPVGKVLSENFPEVDKVTYARDWMPVLKQNGSYFNEDALLADNNFVDVVGLPLVSGNPVTALEQPYSLLISEDLSRKFFGNENAMGKTIFIQDTIPYTVTGVFSNLPANTHLRFNLLASFSSICSSDPGFCEEQFTTGWFNINVYNYVKLREGIERDAFEAKIKDIVQVYGKAEVEKYGYKSFLRLRPFSEIYLHSNLVTGFGKVGDYKLVKLYIGIAIFVLLIAAFNFINLSTIRSMDRAREIGIQKVLGNVKKRLMGQFLMETALLCVVAVLISFLLMLLLLPGFNQIIGKSFERSDLFAPGNLLILVGVLLVMVPLAGFYPALILAGYEPIHVLKGKFSRSVSGTNLRKVLVTFQIFLSIGFIVGILVIWKQIAYMGKQNLGFAKDNLMVVDVEKLPWQMRHEKSGAIKDALLKIPGVTGVTSTNAVPGRSGWDGQFAYAEGMPKDKGVSIEFIPADDDFIKTIGLQLVAGRDFIKGSEADVQSGLIINESAVRVFGWGTPENALGKKLSTSGIDGTVVGVVKDYHQHGLKRKIGGVVLSPVSFINLFAIRYEGKDNKNLMQQVNLAMKPFFMGYQLDMRWMDEYFQQQYQREEKFKSHIEIAAVISLIICCLGLFGLSVFTAQQKAKEISIRKVLGSSASNIIFYLSKELVLLACIAMGIAVPITYWVMNNWLENFAYRTDISWWVFVVAGGAVLLIAFATISFQALKAAFTNPIKYLRTE
jgi:putative ABC transport system permease protein